MVTAFRDIIHALLAASQKASTPSAWHIYNLKAYWPGSLEPLGYIL